MNRCDVDRMMKAMMLKDLRIQCRIRNLSPAGGKEQLSERLADNMIATQDLCVPTPWQCPAANAQSMLLVLFMLLRHTVSLTLCRFLCI